MGLTPSAAIRVVFQRIAIERALPFEGRVPNPETQTAISELEAGEGEAAASAEPLMAALNADD